MMQAAGRSFLGAAKLASIIMGMWAIFVFANLAQSSPAFANDTQICTAALPSCGCNTCGEVDHGRPSCPPGQSLYDDYCLPDCPSGYIRYPGVPGLCLPPVEFGCPDGFEQIPLPNCPEGYVRDLRDPDHCVPDYALLQNGGECPYGLSWSNETGRCQVDCPQGTYRDGYGLCQSYFSHVCPQGYGRDVETGRCVPPGIWPPNYGWVCLATCPQGYVRDIRHPTLCLPPPPSCPQGYDNINGRCEPICDKGTVRDNYGYCVPTTCPQGTYADLRGHCDPLPCPDGTALNADGVCEPPHTGCPQGSENYNGQCTPICNDGLVRDNNGRCVPPHVGCPQGQETYNGQCTAICKDGLVRNSDGRCMPPLTHKPPTFSCPQGFKPDGNGGCTRIIVFVPHGCPDGTVLNRRTQTCQRLQFQPNDNNVPPVFNNPPVFKRPPILLNPGVLKMLNPPAGQGGNGANIQVGCPQGQYRDNNGRCVGK